jgi:hypothetical protein
VKIYVSACSVVKQVVTLIVKLVVISGCWLMRVIYMRTYRYTYIVYLAAVSTYIYFYRYTYIVDLAAG